MDWPSLYWLIAGLLAVLIVVWEVSFRRGKWRRTHGRPQPDLSTMQAGVISGLILILVGLYEIIS